MKCEEKNCSKCELSEWSKWSTCDKCDGKSRRTRFYHGRHCNRTDTVVEEQDCNQCKCTVGNMTYEVYIYIYIYLYIHYNICANTICAKKCI